MIRHNDLTLSYLESVPAGFAGNGDPLVVLIHGRGADATDLAPLATLIGGDRPYRFILPDAPRRFAPAPGMEFGYTWFDGYPPEPASVRESREKFATFLDEIQQRYEADSSRTVLCGFSQGALMALDAGLRSATQIAGIVALSGGIDEANLPADVIMSKPPVLMIHGSEDEMIPIELARHTRRMLQNAGVEPAFHEMPIGHEITEEEIEMISRFVRSILDE